MYFTIYGICDGVEDTSYDREVEDPKDSEKTITEKVPQTTFSLAVPGNRDLVRVSFGADVMPSSNLALKWEESSTMLKVSADILSVKSGIKAKRAWAFASFHGMGIGEAPPAEVKILKDERKKVKDAAKAKREAARKAKKVS